MNSVTVNLVDLLALVGYVGLPLSVLSLCLWLFPLETYPTSRRRKLSGGLGLFLLIVGSFSFPIKYSLQGHYAHGAAFAELPVEWQEFYEELNKIDSALHPEAIKRFAGSEPPRLTVENHGALVGSNLWHDDMNVTAAMRSLKYSSKMNNMVILDFAEGKQ